MYYLVGMRLSCTEFRTLMSPACQHSPVALPWQTFTIPIRSSTSSQTISMSRTSNLPTFRLLRRPDMLGAYCSCVHWGTCSRGDRLYSGLSGLPQHYGS